MPKHDEKIDISKEEVRMLLEQAQKQQPNRPMPSAKDLEAQMDAADMAANGGKRRFFLRREAPPTEPASSWKRHFPGRNEPCPCNSGLKFKRCCLPKIKAGKIKIVGTLE